jgi:hypothetical protein
VKDEVMVVIRVPVGALADEVRSRHGLSEELFDARLEGDSLLLYFRKPNPEELDRPVEHAPTALGLSRELRPSIVRLTKEEAKAAARTRKRRRPTKRNRMKTRGWQVVAKITNSKGQTAVVYKPFVDALFRKKLTPSVERARVAEILRSNGNEPTEASIEYFRMNTLEYLEQVNKQGELA